MNPVTEQLEQSDDHEVFIKDLEANHEAHEFEQAHQQHLADAMAAALRRINARNE